MGNACCNNAEKDQNNLEPNAVKPQAKEESIDPEVIKKATENEDKIVKIQAQVRGHQARSKMKDDQPDNHDLNKPIPSSRRSQKP